MKLEINLPKFRIRRPTNPLTSEGLKALAIVLGAVVLISGVVYAAKFAPPKQKPIVLPASTQAEPVDVPQETEIPEMPTGDLTATDEATLETTASPKPTPMVVPAETPSQILPEVPPITELVLPTN